MPRPDRATDRASDRDADRATAADGPATAPDAEPGGDVVPGLAVAAVAQRLGVAPATLRTWDRRYGLGPSGHSAGAHRRYSPQDVERLLVMRRLTLDGVAPGDAARLAREAEVVPGAPGTVLPGLSRADGIEVRLADTDGAGPVEPLPAAGLIAEPRADQRPETREERTRASATRPVPTPQAVVDAAVAGDEARCAALLDLGTRGDVERWWTDLVDPARTLLHRRTEVDRPGVDAPTVLRGCALGALRARSMGEPTAGAPVVLLVVPPGEDRPLLVHALASALCTRGRDARIVSGPVRAHQAAELVLMTRPAAVVHLSRRADAPADVVERLVADRPDLPQFLLVPEEAIDRMPWGRSVHRARTFTGLLHEVLASAVPAATAAPRPDGVAGA
ncbi:MerR family transcriptional regulator [Cellulomonas marina]|uniref:DNA-binding transcriptional regulator, MerR family n=1 Tax=Cellulomonas marina TaxID=988821 RepID=A0A1I0XQG6_9CELL|nr:MerR family transcriptional regulator [Cellulomonas marina]GIG30028.1 hypothetical protein Cma02nite_26280 [Cellulomonas marina]SFB03295.1 DNA-binding transcriptional regulator, MerR family [Cellulomonas marina]